jgi:hypothetical protein
MTTAASNATGDRREAPARLPEASIAVVATHGVDALRSTLRRIRETVGGAPEVIVLADQHSEEVVTYLTRHYLRGDVAAIGLEASSDEIHHCGLDHALHLASGGVLIRLDDGLDLKPGWYEATLETLAEFDDIGMLGLVVEHEKPRRGRPPKHRRAPEAVDAVDLRAFATRRDLFGEHEAALRGEKCIAGCRFSTRLRSLGARTAYLPGQVRLEPRPAVCSPSSRDCYSELPAHDGPGQAMSALRQVYQLGEEVLLPCMTCGDNEFEVLAAQIEFCDTHDVPIGFLYTLRCSSCHEVQHEEDYQLRCPA